MANYMQNYIKRNGIKYYDLESYRRTSELSALVRLVDRKTTVKTTPQNFFKELGVTDKQLQAINSGIPRQDVLSKPINKLIDVFVEVEYSNYYNIDRILAGKVKYFGGPNAKMRMINALIRTMMDNYIMQESK